VLFVRRLGELNGRTDLRAHSEFKTVGSAFLVFRVLGVTSVTRSLEPVHIWSTTPGSDRCATGPHPANRLILVQMTCKLGSNPMYVGLSQSSTSDTTSPGRQASNWFATSWRRMNEGQVPSLLPKYRADTLQPSSLSHFPSRESSTLPKLLPSPSPLSSSRSVHHFTWIVPPLSGHNRNPAQVVPPHLLKCWTPFPSRLGRARLLPSDFPIRWFLPNCYQGRAFHFSCGEFFQTVISRVAPSIPSIQRIVLSSSQGGACHFVKCSRHLLSVSFKFHWHCFRVPHS
jgi:hypothetical protein